MFPVFPVFVFTFLPRKIPRADGSRYLADPDMGTGNYTQRQLGANPRDTTATKHILDSAEVLIHCRAHITAAPPS